VLFIENKLLYLSPLQDEDSLDEFDFKRLSTAGGGPAYSLTVRAAPPAVITLVTYGYMAELAREAALWLAYEDEIFIDLVVLTQLAPFDLAPLAASLERTRRLLAVEEGTLTHGWGAEVLARMAEQMGGRLSAARRVAARDLPVPSSASLEEALLPGVGDILRAARDLRTAR
ncbi:MAG: hypothetical protein MUO62_17505, partial [Anaerolineales bacterium]|nr:hypothetical protein [Anaerolineales bacterium]